MSRYFGVIVAFLGISAAAGAQATDLPRDVLDFEELPPRCVARTTRGVWGTGPVHVEGTSDRHGTINVAVVVDTEHPEADPDLTTGGYHNALIISRLRPEKPTGPEADWAVGSVSKTDDDPTPGGILSFDFRDVGPVTFHGLTLLDHDDRAASIRIHRTAEAAPLLDSLAPGTDLALTWGRRTWFKLNWFGEPKRRARLSPPSEGQDYFRLQIAPIARSGRATPVDIDSLRARDRKSRSAVGRGRLFAGGIPDVARIEVELGGSSAVDKVVFRAQRAGAASTVDEDLFARIQRYLNDQIEPELEKLETEFFSQWSALTDHWTPTLRSDLDRLLAGLERDLIGSLDAEGVRSGGLLQCPQLKCGCPQLRPLQAWIHVKVEEMRADLAAASEEQLRDLVGALGQVRAVQVAALEPALYLAAAQTGGSVELAQRGGDDSCKEGTFGVRFVCKGQRIWSRAGVVVASVFGPSVELTRSSVNLAGIADPCSPFKLRPMKTDLGQDEIGLRPGEPRRVPRGLYCVLCQSVDGRFLPSSKLDLVTGDEAEPEPLLGQECLGDQTEA